MTNDFKLEGLQGLSANLKELPGNVQQRVVRGALRGGAQVIRKGAKRRVRKRTRRLEKSIVVVNVRGDPTNVLVGFTKPASRRAHFEEFGREGQPANPFMRPAIEQDGDTALQKIGERLGKGIEREAEKLNRQR